jgi:hypothetical protein
MIYRFGLGIERPGAIRRMLFPAGALVVTAVRA